MKTKSLTHIALMAAILCLFAPISIPIPISSVSLSLATFAIYLTAYLLPPKQAVASVGLYLLLGAVGLPVFSGYLGGISRFAAPGGGYLLGYLFLVGISAAFRQRTSRPALRLLGMLLGTAVMYAMGTFWLAYTTGVSFLAALPAGALVFLPLDFLKLLCACSLGKVIKNHIK